MTKPTVLLRYSAFALSLLTVVGPASAYDRDAAVLYSTYWGGFTVNGQWSATNPTAAGTPLSNTPIYGDIGGAAGCAHFVSQSLIAGGIKFTANAATMQQDGSTYWPMLEKETGAPTTGIHSWDSRKYSRTITQANKLAMSLVHSRHGGSFEAKPYTNSSFWARVKPGDVFATYNGDYANKAMANFGSDFFNHIAFITDVEYSTNSAQRDIRISGHNTQYSNQPLKPTTGSTTVNGGSGFPNWEQSSSNIYIITLPDAPVVKSRHVWEIKGGQWTSKSWQWGGAWEGNAPGDMISGEGVVVRFTFDTPMNVNSMPDAKLLYNGTGTSSGLANMQPITANGFNQNGWFVNPTSGQNIKSRTWMGKVYWGQIPGPYVPRTTNTKITIKAQAVDGSFSDADNLLNKYASGANSLLGIWVDTQGSYIKK